MLPVYIYIILYTIIWTMQKDGSSLQGKFMLKKQSEYINFYAAEKNTAVVSAT